MQKTVEAFLTYLSAEGTTPANTLKAYRTDLAQLVVYLAAQGVSEISDLQAYMLTGFYDWLHDQGYATATIARRIVALRAFGAFIMQAGIMPSNPADALRPPVVVRAPRQTLTVSQVDSLREAMVRDGSPEGWRDRAMLEVLAIGGLRAGALMALNVADISLEPMSLAIASRTHTTRIITIPSGAAMALIAYLQLGRPKLLRGNIDQPALFLNHQGQRLTRQGCWVILKGYAEHIGIDGITPELLRQSVVAHRFANGASVGEMQALLGHAARKTTAAYLPARNENSV